MHRRAARGRLSLQKPNIVSALQKDRSPYLFWRRGGNQFLKARLGG
jgi:hypothetical protein